MNARVQDFAGVETDYRVTSGTTTIDPITGLPVYHPVYRLTQTGNNRTLEPYGLPTGLDQNAVMPWNGTVQMQFGVELPVLSVIANGTTTINVTCSAPHGLVTNSQIAVNGLSNVAATGFYSVTVTTATAFTYDIYYPIAPAQEPIETASGLEILLPGGETILTAQPIASSSLLTSETLITTCLIGLPYGYEQIPQVALGGAANSFTSNAYDSANAPILTAGGDEILTVQGEEILTAQRYPFGDA